MDDENPLPPTPAVDEPSLATVPDQARALARRLTRPVVLVGMMGVGKTSLGRRLAAALGTEFVDADEEIERAAQMTIPEIFATYNEAYFRDGERRVIARLLGAGEADAPPSPVAAAKTAPPETAPPETAPPKTAAPKTAAPKTAKVIATGGGAFCDPATRALILERGIAVWLDADLDTLVERTARKENRPLLRQGNPREILGRLKAERQPFYAQAPIRVMSGRMPHARTLGRVLDQIAHWLDGAESPTEPATTAPEPRS